jgi:hypothetical protein
MNIQDSLKLRDIIKKQAGKEFEWGVHDCNTFFIDIHDKMYGSQDIEKVKHQYSNRRGAIVFLNKTLKLTAAQWLHFRKYKKITAKKPKWTAGDVVLIENPAYSSVYIYSEGAFWTVPEGSELVAYDPSAVAKEMTSAWRKTDG